jgi:hypothetical protein
MGWRTDTNFFISAIALPGFLVTIIEGNVNGYLRRRWAWTK